MSAHTSPCNLDRFQERVFDRELRYVETVLCRCCGRVMFGRRRVDSSEADPLCGRCED